jgi:flagellar protein FliO/FliZ
VGFARPRGYRIALRVLAATVCLALLAPVLEPGTALADSFKRDQTPLPPAVTGVGGAKTVSDTGSSSTAGFGRLAIGLVIVIALIFVVRWIMRRANGTKRPTGSGKLAVVATTTLGPNRAVHLLRVGSELVLVGSAEHSVTPIRVYNEAESAALTAELEPEEKFAPLPTTGTTPGPTPGVVPEDPTSRAGFLDELRKRTARK